MRTVRRRRAERGFTLPELIISAAVTVILSGGAVVLLVSQQHAFNQGAGDRALQDAARTALADLGTNLRRAGYGVEPWLAFDLGPVANAPPSWPGATALTTAGYPAGPPGATLPSCNPGVSVTDRDSIAGADDLVFYARDPAFNRTLAAAPTSTKLTFATPINTPMYPGQILQVMCSGASAWAYVTVGAFADVGETNISLSGSCDGGFPYQQAALPTGCFSAGYATARVFRIERFHYYVTRYADADLGAPRPYLMLDRGLWDGGTPLVEPVAPDVEDLQVAYVFPAAAAPLVGAATGTRLSAGPGSIDLTAVPPAYTDTTTAVSRTTNHPANIRGVRISVVVRTPTPDAQQTGADFQTIPAAGNRPTIPNGDPSYRRILVETTEATRNLESRGPFYTPYSTNAGADGLNVGGG